jgi:hypothetical protein
MLVRERLARGVAVLATAAWLLLPGCSADNPVDMNMNTDVGADFVPPDSSVGSAADVPIEVSSDSADGSGGEVATGEVAQDTLDVAPMDGDIDTSADTN